LWRDFPLLEHVLGNSGNWGHCWTTLLSNSDFRSHYSNSDVHKSPPLVPSLFQMNPVHTLISNLILSFHVRLGLPSGLFPIDFQNNILYAFLMSFMFYPLHPFLFDYPNTVIFVEEYELWNSPSSFFHPPVSFFFLGPIFSSASCSQNILKRRNNLCVITNLHPIISDAKL
jgi:hypothetical protein